MLWVLVLYVGLQSSVVVIINATHCSYRTITHTFHQWNTHTLSCEQNYAELVMETIMGFEALHAGCGRRIPVWSGKEARRWLRGRFVKSAEHCGADCNPFIERSSVSVICIRTMCYLKCLYTNTMAVLYSSTIQIYPLFGWKRACKKSMYLDTCHI